MVFTYANCRLIRADERLAANAYLRQPEVQNLGVAACGDENICRLNVAMHNATRMSCVERISDINSRCHEQIEFKRLAADQMLQGFAFEVLHHDEGATVVLTNVVNRANVRMIQAGRRLCFAAEAAEQVLVSSDIFWKKFERNEAAQAGVFGLENHPHSAAPKFFDHPVMRDGLADHRRRHAGI